MKIERYIDHDDYTIDLNVKYKWVYKTVLIVLIIVYLVMGIIVFNILSKNSKDYMTMLVFIIFTGIYYVWYFQITQFIANVLINHSYKL